jgi:alkylation response protein AidB-like acyl-CoA dehydrogenase
MQMVSARKAGTPAAEKGRHMDLNLSEEEREIREWVRTFVRKEIAPLEPDVLARERRNEQGLRPDELTALQEKAKRSGFFGVHTPEEYGGMGLGAMMSALIEVELGRSFVPFRFGGEADNILYFADEEQQQRYLVPTINGDRTSCFAITEPGAGSDARAIRTSARREGDSWVINGEKTFITRGHEADFCMVFAVTDPDRGADGGVTCFLVDREMGWTSEPIDTMGEWGPASLVFDDVRVPHSSILGEEGRGFVLAMRWIGKGRYLLPARALGACERLLEMGMEHARNRVTFGEPIAERQAIQWMIADSAVEIEALRWLVLSAAWQVDQDRDSRQAQSMAKLYGGVKANEIVDRVLQMHGGMGYTRELPVERWYRELRLLRIYEGTDEIQRRTIARNLLKGHASVRGHLG